MELSFGMIFSIILIIIFMGFAFWAVMKFIEPKNAIEIGLFMDDLQGEVDKAWQSVGDYQEPKTFSLPKQIEYVCFMDCESGERGGFRNYYRDLSLGCGGDTNLIFYPYGSGETLDSQIEHIALSEITKSKNPNCFENVNEKVSIIIKKDRDLSPLTILEDGN